MAAEAVYTHQQSRVQSTPVQSSPVQSTPVQPNPVHSSPVQSNQLQSSPLQSHESCWVKSLDAACFIFASQTPVIGRDWRKGWREADSFSEGPRGNLRRFALWTPEPRLNLMMMFVTTITAPLTTVIMILLLLGLLFKVKVQSNPKTQMILQWQDAWNRFSFSDFQKCKEQVIQIKK